MKGAQEVHFFRGSSTELASVSKNVMLSYLCLSLMTPRETVSSARLGKTRGEDRAGCQQVGFSVAVASQGLYSVMRAGGHAMATP